MFLDDVDVVAGLLDVSEWLEVCIDALPHVRTQDVRQQRRKVVQFERVARYSELQLAAACQYVTNKPVVRPIYGFTMSHITNIIRPMASLKQGCEN